MRKILSLVSVTFLTASNAFAQDADVQTPFNNAINSEFCTDLITDIARTQDMINRDLSLQEDLKDGGHLQTLDFLAEMIEKHEEILKTQQGDFKESCISAPET